jgi:ribosomal protein S18 acetylase RimI-like enzyme
VFEDRELFADYLTRYYTDAEPESSWVMEVDGKVSGYLLGSRKPARQRGHDARALPWLVARGVWRYPQYSEASRRYVHWILNRAWREVPESPKAAAHFHINVLPGARRLVAAREMVAAYLASLVEAGEQRVFGQMVVFEGRRGPEMFARYGFEVVNRREITKYRGAFSGKVYLCTVVKDLTKSPVL